LEEGEEEEDSAVLASGAEASSVPPHVVVQSLAGEQVFDCEFTEPLRVSDLVALLHDFDARQYGSFKLVLAGRVLQPPELICGGGDGAPITIMLVSTTTTQCRASAASLLEHSFCCSGLSSQGDFAKWLKALAA